jgi:hypothetical protein
MPIRLELEGESLPDSILSDAPVRLACSRTTSRLEEEEERTGGLEYGRNVQVRLAIPRRLMIPTLGITTRPPNKH